MKKLIFNLLLMLVSIQAFACPECEKRQPKILKGIAHGAGPEGNLDYIIVWAVVIITVITLFFAIKWLVKPNENQPNHVKYSILNFD